MPVGESPFDKLDPSKIPAEERFQGIPKEVVAVLGHRQPAESYLLGKVTISAKGHLILFGCADGSAILWDLATGAPRKLWGKRGVMVGSVALSADGQRALGGGWNQPIFVWDVATGNVLHRLGTDKQLIGPLAFDPSDEEGRRVLVGHVVRDAPSSAIQLWDVESAEMLQAYESHTRPAYALAFSPNGQRFVSCGSYQDESVCVWDVEKGGELRRFKLKGPLTQGAQRGGTLTSVAFSPNGRYVLAGGKAVGKLETVAAWLWDLKQKGPSPRVSLPHPSPVFSVAFSPDGKAMATVGGDARIILWDCPSGSKQREIPLIPLAQPNTGNISLAFAPDGRHLVVAHGSGAVYILRLAPPPAKPRQ